MIHPGFIAIIHERHNKRKATNKFACLSKIRIFANI